MQKNVVRIWLGYARPELLEEKGRPYFYQQLGGAFIPATVQLMAPLGLQAYIPTVLGEKKTPWVPDEIALVFYRSQEDYYRASRDSCAGRSYGILHSAVFGFKEQGGRPPSQSGFPEPFNGQPSQSGAIELFDRAASWQKKIVLSEVSVRTHVSVEVFRQKVCKQMLRLQQHPPSLLQGVYFYLSDNLLVCWSCWQGVCESLLEPVEAEIGKVVASCIGQPASVPSLIFATYPGLKVEDDVSWNFEFPGLPSS